MSFTPSITMDNLFTVMGGFLLGITPSGMQVFQSQVNRVATVVGPFIEMTSLRTPYISTNIETFNNGTGMSDFLAPSEWVVQLDIYGDGAQDNALTISRLVRTDYACTTLAATGFDLQPLYAGEPRNNVMLNAEQQYEDRWTVEVTLQFNPVISAPQQSATSLVPVLIEIDATYPPGV